MGGLARSGWRGWDKVLGVLWCPSAGHGNASTVPRCSPKVKLGPWSVLGPYSVPERLPWGQWREIEQQLVLFSQCENRF